MRRRSVLRKALLICGAVSSLLYLGMNVLIPMQYDGYSSVSETRSTIFPK
jgi:hypothetical protein